jgi:hypothetical protein
VAGSSSAAASAGIGSSSHPRSTEATTTAAGPFSARTEGVGAEGRDLPPPLPMEQEMVGELVDMLAKTVDRLQGLLGMMRE